MSVMKDELAHRSAGKKYNSASDEEAVWYGRNMCLLQILAVLILVLAVLCAHIWHRKQSGDQSSESGASKYARKVTSPLKNDENYTTGKGKFTLNTEPSTESENLFGKYKQSDFRHVTHNISDDQSSKPRGVRKSEETPPSAGKNGENSTRDKGKYTLKTESSSESANESDFRHVNQNIVLQVKDEVLLASDNGLFVLSAAGLIQYQVVDGRFYDISNDGDILLACTGLNTNVIQIRVLVHDDKKRIAAREILIEKKMGRPGYVSITLYNKYIYLKPLGIGDANIYQYTLGGELVKTYTSNKDLRLIAVDTWGTILLCDWGNKNLLRLTAWGEWKAYKPGGTDALVRPWDVIIVDNYPYILLWDGNQSIIKISRFEIVK